MKKTYRRKGSTKRKFYRKRRISARFIVILVSFFIAVLMIAWGVWWSMSYVQRKRLAEEVRAYDDTFAPGVSINGMTLTGYGYHEAHEALLEKYATSLNQPITLTFGERVWTFMPQDVGVKIDLESQLDIAWEYGKRGTDLERQSELQSLLEEPVELSAVLTYDAQALSNLVSGIKAEVDCDPVNATRTIIDNEKFSFTDSSDGYRLDEKALEDQLTQLILEGGERELELKPQVLPANPSRADLEQATVLLAECNTSLKGSSSKRNSNVNLALGYFNYLQVQPGEKVSFNKIVGKRTKENGFTNAPEYDGTTVITGVGGGTCQASTTVYGAVIRAGLKILERHPHKMTVGYVEGSQDAAVSDDNKDLRFENNTESTLIFFAWIDTNKDVATVKIYGKPLDAHMRIEIESVITQTDIRGGGATYRNDTEGTRVWYKDDPPVLIEQGKPGMRSEAYRVYYDLATNQEMKREKLSSDYYEPQNNVYLVGIHERE